MNALDVVGGVFAIIGALFLFLGALGIYRMPDIYNRLHAGTKATTLGNIFTLTGLALIEPAWAPKIILVIVFITLTNPVSSHAIARASLRAGVKPVGHDDFTSTCPTLKEDS